MSFQDLKRAALACLALAVALPVIAQQASPLAGGNPALPLVRI